MRETKLCFPLSQTVMQTVREHIRDVKDFPIPGVVFKDIGDVFSSPECLTIILDKLVELYKDKGVTKVVGLESRGFIFAPMLAQRLGAGFVPLRKPGKLPGEVASYTYDLEYKKGETIEIQTRQVGPEDVVVVHDDILATGGTMEAAVHLLEQQGVKQENMYLNLILAIEALGGEKVLAGKSKSLDILLRV